MILPGFGKEVITEPSREDQRTIFIVVRTSGDAIPFHHRRHHQSEYTIVTEPGPRRYATLTNYHHIPVCRLSELTNRIFQRISHEDFVVRDSFS